MISLLNIDCMEYMATVPNKYFDLAIVDPPYGIGASMGVGLHSRNKYQKAEKMWDVRIPDDTYFNELFRISVNQIVCGANYFSSFLPSSKSFICWIKNNPAPNFAEAEILWTSFNINGKVYDSRKQIQHEIMWEGGSIHPTQKPVQLYKWLLKNYAKPEFKIIDTHGGSMSSVIACWDFGIAEMVCCEIDKDYFEAGKKRFEIHKMQLKMQLK